MNGSPWWPPGLLRRPEIAGAGSIRRALGSLDAEGGCLWLVERAGTFAGLVAPAPGDLVAAAIGEQALAAALAAASSRSPDAAEPSHAAHQSSGRLPDTDGPRRPPVRDAPQTAAPAPGAPHSVVDRANTRRPVPTPGVSGDTTGVGRTTSTSTWDHASAGRVVIENPGWPRSRLAAVAGFAPASRREAAAPRSGDGSSGGSGPGRPGSVAGPGSAPPTLDTDTADAGRQGAAPAGIAPVSALGDPRPHGQSGLAGLVDLWEASAGEHAATSGHRPPERPHGGRAGFAPPGVEQTSAHLRSRPIAGADRGIAALEGKRASDATFDLEAEAQLLELLERALRGEARRLGVDLDQGGLL